MSALITTQAGRLALARSLFRSLLALAGLCLAAALAANLWKLLP